MHRQIANNGIRAQAIMERMNVEFSVYNRRSRRLLGISQSDTRKRIQSKSTAYMAPGQGYEYRQCEVYNKYLALLEEASNTAIHTYADLLAALEKRHRFLKNRVADFPSRTDDVLRRTLFRCGN
jgi:glucuronate isomerase